MLLLLLLASLQIPIYFMAAVCVLLLLLLRPNISRRHTPGLAALQPFSCIHLLLLLSSLQVPIYFSAPMAACANQYYRLLLQPITTRHKPGPIALSTLLMRPSAAAAAAAAAGSHLLQCAYGSARQPILPPTAQLGLRPRQAGAPRHTRSRVWIQQDAALAA
jgi:hypothetical protein